MTPPAIEPGVRRLDRPRRVAAAVAASFRVALMTALQYRASFIAEAVVAVFWLAWTIVPLFVVYRFGDGLAGWSRDQALLVVGFFITLSGVLDAFVDPNLGAVVQHVRDGTLDFLLLKPIDTQLLVSLHRSAPAKIPHVLAGLVVSGVAASRLPVPPTAGHVAVSAGFLVAGILVLHSLWTLVVSLSFKLVRVDNLSYLIRSVVDAGRWPVAFYPPAVRIVLTFVIPVALMTSYPAMALRGSLTLRGALLGLGVAAAFVLAARLAWTRAIRHYASASS